MIVNTIYNHTRRGTGTNVEEDKFIGTKHIRGTLKKSMLVKTKSLHGSKENIPSTKTITIH